MANVKRISVPASYSRYVLFMKLLLPGIALGLTSMLFLWPQIKVSDSPFSINFKTIQTSNTDDLSMINARFVGTDNKNQPFSITADMAKNIRLGGTSLELEMPKADIGTNDGNWLVIIANNGVYHQKSQTLDLLGSVNLFHDSGYEFNTEKATVDLIKGVAISNTLINGQGPFGTLTAEGLRIEKKNNQFLFKGKTKLVINSNAKKKM